MAITLVEDFYKATITRNWSTTTGEFNVSKTPTVVPGILVVSPNSPTEREIIRYTEIGTNTYGPYVKVDKEEHRGLSGTTTKKHTIGEQIRMNVTAIHWDELVAEAKSPTVDVGSTTTVGEEEDASVTNVGTNKNAIFNFEIPKGDTGAKITSAQFDGDDIEFGLDDSSTVKIVDGKKDLKGERGDEGDDGSDGREIELDNDGTNIKWRYVGDVSWTNLVAISSLKGNKGDDGREIELDVSGGYINWRYKNEVSWTPLVDLDTLKGSKGDDGISFVWKGVYDGSTEYKENDVVNYLGSSYVALQTTQGNLPTDTNNWDLMAEKGTDGAGSGDMIASTYDPTNIQGDAFDMDNMVGGSVNKLVTDTEKNTWNSKLDDITGESIGSLSDVDDIGKANGKVLKYNSISGNWEPKDDENTTYDASDFDIKDLTDSLSKRTSWDAKQEKLTSQVLEIKTTDWDGSNEATMTVSGIVAGSIIWLSPVEASAEDFIEAGVRAISQDTDEIVFKCEEIPTNDININLVIA